MNASSMCRAGRRDRVTVAEPALRRLARRCLREPLPREIAPARFQMKRQLVVDVPAYVRTPDAAFRTVVFRHQRLNIPLCA
jgi:hypothetical protein